MESKTEEFASKLDAIEAGKRQPKAFELYEEFTRSRLLAIVRMRQHEYEKADGEKREKMSIEVENEIEEFWTWLVQKKDVEPTVAHYYSVSLKSLLLGIPLGAQIAQLFDIALNKYPGASEF